MSKMRIHELAKELGVDSKEILSSLARKNIQVKNHMSTVDEDVAAELRKEFRKSMTEKSVAKTPAGKEAAGPAAEKETARGTADKQTAKPAAGRETAKSASKKPVEKTAAEKAEETVPRKKNIVQVFRPQNAKNTGRITPGRAGGRTLPPTRPGQRPAGAAAAGRMAGASPQRPVRSQGGRSNPEEAAAQVRRPQAGAVQSRVQEGVSRPQPGSPQSHPQGGILNPVKENAARSSASGTAPAKENPSRPQTGAPALAKEGASHAQTEVSQQPGEERIAQLQTEKTVTPVRENTSNPQTGAPKSQTQENINRSQPAVPSLSAQEETSHSHTSAPESRMPKGSQEKGQEFRSSREDFGQKGQRGTERRPFRTGGDARGMQSERGDRGDRGDRGFRSGSSEGRLYRGGQERSGESRSFRGSQERSGEARPGRDGFGQRERGQRSGERRYSRDGEGRGQSLERGEYGQRSQGRQGGRRDDRNSMNAPIVEQQKSQRNKVKEKEKDYKKKELRDEEFENKGKRGKKTKPAVEVKKPQTKQAPVEEIKQIVLPETLTLKELADKMKVVPSVIIKKLFMQGKIVTVNQEIDFDTAEEIAMEFNILCEKEEVVDVIEELLKEDEEDEGVMQKRPPVVCVMGHVDHGKTSLLDAIRHTNVIDREAGGITQHIGAYVVDINGEKITFLDTPGHEAFTAMRMRGANSTDIAILVVAADDGVMPQTIEAISHAKAAGIEIIVAVNKIDKPSANVERVKQELTEYELVAEDWGGSTVFVPVSAKTKEGIPDLLEMILLTAEVMELKANPDRSARGLVIEAQLDKGKGPVATVLVQKGTLRVGDAIAAGSAHGKVRAMMDDKGRRVKEAGPSQPVEILGLNDVPNAGEVFVGCETEKEARSFAETFISQGKVKLLEDTKSKMSLDDLFTQIKEGNLKELNIVVKADVQGSVEALKQSLLKLSNEEVVIKIIHGGVGAINESDVSLASASNAIIIGFNVRPDATAKEIADREGVDLRLYRVIYNAIEDVEAAMKGMLDPVFEEKILGHAEVRQTFKASGVGTIAGSYVQDGVFERNCSVRLTRDGIVIYDGALASLKRFKDDVKEVKAGYECGFVFQNFNDIKEGDLAEAYKMVEVERK